MEGGGLWERRSVGGEKKKWSMVFEFHGICLEVAGFRLDAPARKRVVVVVVVVAILEARGKYHTPRLFPQRKHLRPASSTCPRGGGDKRPSRLLFDRPHKPDVEREEHR